LHRISRRERKELEYVDIPSRLEDLNTPPGIISIGLTGDAYEVEITDYH
jgi:hypothetical protein